MSKHNKNTQQPELTHLPLSTYQYMVKWAEKKYEMETVREESIIQQASAMQNGFSFMTAAVFVVCPIVIEHCGAFLSAGWIIGIFSVITLLLLISLLFATMAQNRMKYDTFPDVKEMNQHIFTYYADFDTEEKQSQYDADRYAEFQKAISKNNDIRVKYVCVSMRFFYATLFACILSFVLVMLKYKGVI